MGPAILVALAACAEVAPTGSSGPDEVVEPRPAEHGSPPARTTMPRVPDAAVAPRTPSCAAQLPSTGDPAGKALAREPFACFGACGPSCEAECRQTPAQVYRSYVDADGGARCLRCTYEVKQCKSHAFCRWHDECYRQCDLRWEALHPEAPPGDPDNDCYLTCSNPVATATQSCALNWSQLSHDQPYVSDDCWDGSEIVYTELSAEVTLDGACSDSDTKVTPPDWGVAKWSGSPAPSVLPQGYSCSADEECPDRTQLCVDVGSAGVNGSGRCTDLVVPKVHIPLLTPPGTFDPANRTQSGDACAFDFQCSSGCCRGGQCEPGGT